MTTTNNSTVIHQATINERRFETWIQINRNDGTAIQCSVARGPLVGETRLGIFIFTPEDEDGPDDPRFAEDETLTVVEAVDEPFLEDVTLSAAEAKTLRDFLNRPEVVALLDQE